VVGVEPAIHDGVGVVEVVGQFRDFDIGVLIAIPVFLWRPEGLVRMVIGRAEQERLAVLLRADGMKIFKGAKVGFFVVAKRGVPGVKSGLVLDKNSGLELDTFEGLLSEPEV